MSKKEERKSNASRAEYEAIKLDASRYILEEHPTFKQFTYYMKDAHGYSRRTAENMWGKLWEELRERFILQKDKLISKHLERTWTLYRAAVEKGDLSTARAILADISKLQGLNEPEKQEVNTKTDVVFVFGDENIESEQVDDDGEEE